MSSEAEENGIREAINYYAEGMKVGNVEILRKAFHDQAILCGYLGDEMIAAPIEGLYGWVNSNPASAETSEVYSCSILTIEVTGRVAAAAVRETSHEGNWIDYFHLLRVGEKWLIVSKLWDAEP